MEDVTVPVDGGTINVWHRQPSGDNSTIVLIHGLSGTSRWWTRVIEHLPAETGLIALDVRGRGGSHDAPAPFALTTIADDVVRSLDHLDVTKAVVAGYSMGGWIAAVFAQRHGERITRAVLVDGGFPIPSPPDTDADTIIEAVVGPSLARLDIGFPDPGSFFDYWKSHPALEKHWDDGMRRALDFELVETDNGYRVRINPEAVRVNAHEITVDPDLKGAGQGVSVPAHLIVAERGTADQPGGMIPLATAENAAITMPNLTMEYLPGVNHYTLLLGAGAVAVAGAIANS